MGMPARRFDVEPFRRSHLQVVPEPPARAARPQRPARPVQHARVASASAHARTRMSAQEARSRSVFLMFATFMVLTVIIGGVRVAFVARAAEASLSESKIQAQLRTERAERDRLAVQRSSLSSPSRIADIAEATMEMGKPKSVKYVTLDAATAGVPVASAGSGITGSVFSAIMELSAGEAQSLLVGDLGLAGSR